MDSKSILEKLFERNDLSDREVKVLLVSCIKGELTEFQIAGFLMAFRVKGETVDEITSFIQAMRKYTIPFSITSDAIDTCGTGGDNKGTFNISTAVAFVLAGAGVPVIKHGNKAASSLCGSADVLSELGIYINLTPKQAKKVFEKVGMIFLFAPLYHPAMKQIALIRKSLSTKTIFNFIGPFLNPAKVKRQIIGVPSISLAEKLSLVAAKLGYMHVLIVSSDKGMDEIATNEITTVFEVIGKTITKRKINPQQFGFSKSTATEIIGGNAFENAGILKKILSGKKDAKRDIVVINSAFGFYTAGKVKTIEQGILLAEESIDSGAAAAVLHNLIRETQKYGR